MEKNTSSSADEPVNGVQSSFQDIVIWPLIEMLRTVLLIEPDHICLSVPLTSEDYRAFS